MSKKSSKKMSKKSKKSKKARREANPQITVRGALVKYVWSNLDVKKVAAEKGMAPIGVPAKIVQMVMTEAMKGHTMKEEDKKSMSFWMGVQKDAMKNVIEKFAMNHVN
jgi:iron-sulfur cluster repair protein YtfE (RIC family)